MKYEARLPSLSLVIHQSVFDILTKVCISSQVFELLSQLPARQMTLDLPIRISQRSVSLPEQNHIILTPNAGLLYCPQRKTKEDGQIVWLGCKNKIWNSSCGLNYEFRCLFSSTPVLVIFSARRLWSHERSPGNQRAVLDSSSHWEEIFWETLLSHGLGFPSNTQCFLSIRGHSQKDWESWNKKTKDNKSKRARKPIWSAHGYAVILHPLIITAHGRNLRGRLG